MSMTSTVSPSAGTITNLADLLIAVFTLVAERMKREPSAAARHIRAMRDAVFQVAEFLGRPPQQISVDEFLVSDLLRIAGTPGTTPTLVPPAERLRRLQDLAQHARAFGCG